MLDSTFLRPVAHRGLHDAGRNVIENTAPAFAAAASRGLAIECDLQPAAGGFPVVFHDTTLDRLTTSTGPVSALDAHAIDRVAHKGSGNRILTFAALLDLVGGSVPLLVEIKSEWAPPDLLFLRQISYTVAGYQGPLAFMSFDPAVMTVLRELAPSVPRGIVSGSYGSGDEEWWPSKLSIERRADLRDLLLSGPAEPSFYAYEVDALPTPVTRYTREVAALPLFTWTVRSEAQRKAAALWADAPIFEGEVPAGR